MNATGGLDSDTIRQRIDSLSAKQRSLLERLLAARGDAESEVISAARSRSDTTPLSYAQQRLWFLDQLQPGNPAYNIALPTRLVGRLHLPALEASLNEIVRRHEVLRTAFVAVDGQPLQSVVRQAQVPVPVIDLRRLSPPERAAEAVRQVNAETCRPFTLTQAPLFRASVLHLADEEYVLILVLHHIVADGWSLGILAHELHELYAAYRSHQPAPLPVLPIQYGDFSVWQRAQLRGTELTEQLDYWKRKLAGLPPLELYTDHPRPPVMTFNGASSALRLGRDLTERAKRLSREEGVTLYMTLLACFQTLLHRYTGQDDIVVGTPIAARTRPEIEPLIGFFANTLVLRTSCSGNPTVRDLLKRVRETVTGGVDHQDYPFERLVEVLQPERDPRVNPLFQVIFALQIGPTATLDLAGMEAHPVVPDQTTAKFDLSLELVETERGVEGRFEYNTDLFDAGTIERMAGHYRTLLEGMVAAPETRIGALELLPAAERAQVLHGWQGVVTAHDEATQADAARGRFVHELVEEQATQQPDAVAVIGQGGPVTYGELNRRANKLARYLQELGVGPDVVVGVLLERSPALVIGLLAVLKAGGAYLPLDPSYPSERLTLMLDDAGAAVVLTQEALAEQVVRARSRVVRADTLWDGTLEAAEPVVSMVTAQHLAYVIYTSGSTGVPKGVAIPHAGLTNLVSWHQQTYAVTQDDRATQLAGLAFDASVWEVWPYLTAGARLYLPEEETRASMPRLVDWLTTEGITLSFLPTPLAEMVIEEEWPTNVRLRALLTGGDRLRRAPRRALPFAFINHYGPTECSVVSTAIAVSSDSASDVPPPIGWPISNMRVYVLDGGLQPVPIGVPGELYLGGAGLARGYLYRPALTAERFCPDPFAEAPGGRLYRTGDIVRYRADGAIEFLGRRDNQVKLRGFRIELGEIEAALSGHPDVRDAVVVAREDRPGERHLVAYLTGREAARTDFEELRGHLRARLPNYMLPTAFVRLDTLPLSPNGKVNRKALPAPEQDRSELETAYMAPRTAAEEILAGIWAGVLGLERVGVRDNYFALGGDSILSIQIIARANQAGLRLTPKQVFQHQTIAELAAAADRMAVMAPDVSADQGPVSGAVPLTPIQHWFFEQEQPDPHHFNQAVFLQMRRPPAPTVLEQALRLLLLHHDALRLRFTRVDGLWRQSNAGPEAIDPAPLAVVDLAAVPVAEQLRVLEAHVAEVQSSLDLARGPLLRATLFNFGADHPSQLLLVIHHLAIDGVSWRILLEDLAALYEQIEHGQPTRLPARTTSFREWATRLGEYARSGALDWEADYWRRAVRPAPLPVDFAGNANTVASARVVSSTLSAEETHTLLHEVPGAYRARINDVLLTGLLYSMLEWTGSRALLLMLEGHGREAILDGVDVSRTVGWFTAAFPVFLTLKEAQVSDRRAALTAIKEQLRQVPRNGIGYGLLRYLRGDDAIAERLCSLGQPEISFNYLGQFDQALPASSPLQSSNQVIGAARSPLALRRYLLEVDSLIVGGRFRVDWTYSEHVHRRATVERLAQGFMESLRALLPNTSGPSPEAPGYTPSDFPLAKLKQRQLDKFLAKDRKAGGQLPR